MVLQFIEQKIAALHESIPGTMRTIQKGPRLSVIGQEQTLAGTGTEWIGRD